VKYALPVLPFRYVYFYLVPDGDFDDDDDFCKDGDDSLLVVDDDSDAEDEHETNISLPVNLISRLDGCLGAFTSVTLPGKLTAEQKRTS